MKIKSIITLFSVVALFMLTISAEAQTKDSEKENTNEKIFATTNVTQADTIVKNKNFFQRLFAGKDKKKDTTLIKIYLPAPYLPAIDVPKIAKEQAPPVEKQPKKEMLSEDQRTELNAAMTTIQSILSEHEEAKTEHKNDVNDLTDKYAVKKIDRGITQKVFVPKGQLILGGTIGYTQFKANDYEFLMIKDIEANVYTTGVKVSAAWAFTNDIAGGVKFDYSRTQMNFDNIDINLSEDMVFSIKDYKSIRHVYTASAFLRTYINIGNSGRFGMFNDVVVSFGGGEGKILNGEGKELVGTYEKIQNVGFNLAPGIAVFATDFLAIGASVGILGFNYSKTEQITNQVYQGSFESFSANFKINILSVNLGLQFYF